MQALTVIFNTPIPYTEAVALQEQLVRARLEDRLPDTVLMLEHPPVVTIGNRGRRNHLLLAPAELARRGIELYESSRGGDVTFHAPGQLIIYPIIRLGANEADAHGYLHNLEEVALRTAADFGVQAFRRPGMTGAWTAAGKLAAIGIRLKRWVTSHGMSFNVCPDMTGFQAIVPCGLAGEAVVSLRQLLTDAAPGLHQVREVMAGHFSEVCRRPLAKAAPDRMPAALREILAGHLTAFT